MMRTVLSATVLLGIALLGYISTAGASAQGQAIQAGLTTGEKVRLVYEPDRGAQECTVIDVRGDFLGCRNERPGAGQINYTRWYNLRMIIRIDRPQQN